MMMFSSSGGGFRSGKQQVVPVDYKADVSQRLIDATHGGDEWSAVECMADPCVDVNFIGTVSLRAKRTEIVLCDESPLEVRVEYEEFNTDVTALFLAAHGGNLTLVKKLLSVGADVNQRLFRGYATTAAVREGHLEVLDVLIKAGACQEACEDAVLEASYLGEARAAELLMSSDLIRSQVAVHALVSASCRGFVNVVDALIKCEVDVNAIDRVLLQSSKPVLHASVDCDALTAAVVSRQISVVRLLLQTGVKMNTMVRLGAWSWDMDTGDELRVGAGLSEAYSITWCAVEYFEASGSILRMLVRHLSPNTLHCGRTLLHHAILCDNVRAVEELLKSGIDKETPVEISSKTDLRPIHLATRFGYADILQCLIAAGCNIDSKTALGDTALMICSRHKHQDCLKVLVSGGADFGLINSDGQSASSIATSVKWTLSFQQVVVDAILAGKVIHSSNASVFSILMFVTRANNAEALKKLIEGSNINLDEQDNDGYSAAMIAAAAGHVEVFKLLLHAGANINLQNKHGETAISISELNQNSDELEKVMLEYAVEEGRNNTTGINALHCAAKRGDQDLVHTLINKGYEVNATDSDGYTSLMLAAKGGHGQVCELLISNGAKCDIENAKHETALALAKETGKDNTAEQVILDELAVNLVINGSFVKKHTKCGKGSPHLKLLKMVEKVGILQWGKSSKRNVICKAAEVGPSAKFRQNCRRKLDLEDTGVFHVVTTKNKEVHFVSQGGLEMAQLWVRGISLVTKKATSSTA